MKKSIKVMELNKKYGNIILLEIIDTEVKGDRFKLKFKCDCGNIFLRKKSNFSYALRNFNVENFTCGKSCELKQKDYAGKKVGRLKYLKSCSRYENENLKDKQGGFLWECECDCGDISLYRPSNITNSIKKNKITACRKCVKNKGIYEGFKLGEFTAIEEITPYKKWKFRCSCGYEKIRDIVRLTNGKGKLHCGCKKYEKPLLAFKNFTSSFIGKYRTRANSKKLKFDIDNEFLYNIWNKQNKKCYYSNLEISPELENISIDRINSELGYTKDNVCLVEKRINFIKFTFDEKYFLNLIKQIIEKKLNLNKIKPFIITERKFKSFKKNAFARNINFNLSITTLQELLKKQNYICNISNVNLDENNYSLDRIDSKDDYNIRNIQFILKDINLSKINLNEKEYFNLCNLIYKNKVKNNES